MAEMRPHLVDGWSDDGEIQPVLAADIAIEDFADVQPEINVGGRLSFIEPPRVQLRKHDPQLTLAAMAAPQASAGLRPLKMASTPSPISFNTLPP